MTKSKTNAFSSMGLRRIKNLTCSLLLFLLISNCAKAQVAGCTVTGSMGGAACNLPLSSGSISFGTAKLSGTNFYSVASCTTTNPYSDLTSTVSCNVTALQSYTLTLQSFISTSSFATTYAAWVDWNGNGVFTDAGESIIPNNTFFAANATLSFTSTPFTVPNVSGNYRMRVAVWGGGTTAGTTITPCAATGSFYGEYKDFKVVVTPATACSGIPASLVVTPSSSSICPSASTNIALTVDASGYTYQWQESNAFAGPYSNVTGGSGATTASFTTPVGSSLPFTTTYYRCNVTCTASGQTTASQVSTISLNSFLNCYCTPTFASANGGTRGITQVILNGVPVINNPTTVNSVSPYYSLYTAASPIANAGLSLNTGYTLQVKVGTQANTSHRAGAWIDYNQNGVFETTEFIGAFAAAVAPGATGSIAFTVPGTALSGVTTMRVIGRFGTTNTIANNQACASFTGTAAAGGAGEVEDYRVVVSGGCTAPTIQASGINFSNVLSTSTTVNWTRGDGDAGVIVVARLSTSVNTLPLSGTSYTANAVFGSGSQIGSGNYVVYSGTGTSVNVTNLLPSANYVYSVYEYNSGGTCYGTAGTANQTTASCSPLTNATNAVFSNMLNNALTLNFTRGSGTNVLVVARLTATAQVQPAYNTSYTANTVFGSGNTTGTGNFVVLNGTASTVTVTGLANASSYSFDVYEYNASPNCYATSPLVAVTSTLDGTTSGGCAASVVRTTSAQFSGNDANYTSIAPAVVINNVGTTTGYYQGGAINTPGPGLPIGFNFVYNGTTYTTFGLGVNGYIWFGSGVPSPTATYPIGNASPNLGGSGTIDGIICAAGIYLENANTPSVRNIGYTLSGIAPNRVLKIQWQGYSTTPGFSACNGSFNDGNRFDFQIILNENGGVNSNKIGIAFPDMSPYCVSETGPGSLVQVGLRGADNTSFTNRSGNLNFSGSNWVATAGTLSSQTCDLGPFTGNYIVGNVLLTFTQALTTGPTINGFAAGGSASNSCPAVTVPLTAGAGFTSYQWFLNGSIIPGPGSSASTYTATQSGSYTVVGKNGTCYVQSNAFTVTINSCGIAPSFTTCPGNQSANTSGLCNATVNYTVVASGTPAPTLTYSFSGATTASGSGDGSGSLFNKGTTIVTITASNGFLPNATCSFNVVVSDNENPVPTLASLPDITAECSATVTAPTATDNCAGTVTATTVDPTSYNTQGSFVIHWSYDDGAGNIVTQNQNVIIDDVTSPIPTLTSLPDITAECSATATAPTATDNCAGTVTATTVDPTSYNTQGSFVIHWSYDDGGGNIVTQNQNVIIDDVTNPVPTIASLPNIMAECSATATAPTATDNCAGTITATTVDPTSYSAQGSFVIHWSYDDGGGNIVTQNQNVIIDDVTNPIISNCPLNIISCNPVVSWTAPTASDNCTIPSLNSNFSPGATFPVGTTTVTYTADDGNGNTATCSFNVTINSSSIQATSATSDSPFNTICVGGSTNLSVNGGSLGLGASWKWYSGSCGGTLVGTGPSISVSPTTSTTYFVRAEGTCNITACASVAMVVSSSPVTSLALMPFTGMPANLCNGTVATLSVAPVNKATFYVWDAPTGSYFNGNPLNISPFTTATPSVTITFGNPSGSLYTIGVQAGNACGSSVRQSQKVRGLTSVPASISGALTACANTSVNYSTPSVTGASSYLWTITGNASVSGTGTTATVTFGSTWTGGTLCVAAQTSCYTSPTKCISITNTASTLNAISGTFTGCPNSVLNYSVPASSGAASYSWTAPPGSSVTSGQGTNSVSITFSPTYNAAGNICVNVTSVCGVTSANKCKTVAPGLPAQPSTISGPGSGLCNQTVVFNCPSQGAGTTYNWTAPAGAIINSGQNTTAINVSFGALTTGNMCVVAQNACGNSTSRCISVKGAPGTPGAITAIPGSWCANESGIEFGVNVSGLTGSYTLSWLYPTLPVATYVFGGGNSTSLLMDWGTGNGAINVKASNACGSGTKTSTWGSSCREAAADDFSSLSVSPNPTTGILNVIYHATKGNTLINVLDLAGRVVMMQNINSVDGANTTQIDMSKLAKGAYMLNVLSTQGSKQVKVVVE